MKIADLKNNVDEHLTMNPPKGFTWLNQDLVNMFMEHGSVLPVKLSLTYGEFLVYEYKLTSISTAYGVFDNDKLLVFAEVRKFISLNSNIKGYHQLYRLERTKQVHSQDIPAALFHYLVQDLGYKLLSDNTMSNEGNRFWENMIHRGQVGISIIDVVTGKHYLIDSVKDGVYSDRDSAKILEPKNDLKQDIFKDGTRKIRNNYRFYYCAEGSGSHLLKEEIESRKNALWPDEHLLIMFGQQNYPDYC